MLVSAAIAGVIAIYLGYTWDDIMDSIVSKLSKTMPAIFILIIVGFMIGSWMIGGTIPMMVFYGLKLISRNIWLLLHFWLLRSSLYVQEHPGVLREPSA